jgi:hypothetical protein
MHIRIYSRIARPTLAVTDYTGKARMGLEYVQGLCTLKGGTPDYHSPVFLVQQYNFICLENYAYMYALVSMSSQLMQQRYMLTKRAVH